MGGQTELRDIVPRGVLPVSYISDVNAVPAAGGGRPL